ncbi:MAG TPA: serine/threonine-protein kinase, partial [Kofleriaceae bacterium]
MTCYSGRRVACLEENTLFDYLCDRLDVAARDAVADHAAGCDSCREMIAAAALQLTRTTTGEVGALGSGPRPPPPPSDEAREPELIAGKYRLLRQIGSGGMGTVHEAVNTWTGRRVAVKQLRSAASRDPTAAQRFMREARSASRIAHPNVVDILDLGQDPETGALFMVQELLVGTTLRQRLTERGALPVDEAVHVVLPALSALAVAHAAHLVHRDLKPDNIFLARDANGRELTKLIDFGLSRPFSDTGDLAITEHGRQLGTPFYMSPEQLRGHPELDDRTDVWSIGVVLFEAVSGARPFRGPSHSELVVQILKEPVPRLAELAPGVPAAFSALIDRTLERDRERRPRAGELHDALEEMIRRPELLALPPGNPYRGILPFEAEHRGVFFGRASEVALLVARMRSESFVLVAGDSGVGKSSLVRA